MKITPENIDNIKFMNASDQGVVISFAEFPESDAILFSRQLGQRFHDAAPIGLRDVIPGMNNLLICYDVLRCSAKDMIALALDLALGLDASSNIACRHWRIPVCYGNDAGGDDFGPDLTEVATATGLSPQAVIERHTNHDLTVAIMGFLPGLAYMKGVDDALYLPRRSTPRQRVPALSVGIAMDQTVIYPLESPGGWNLIGRIPIHPFNPSRVDPVLFRAGDRISFYAVDRKTYDQMHQASSNGEDVVTPSIVGQTP